jgi:hypothetical protein
VLPDKEFTGDRLGSTQSTSRFRNKRFIWLVKHNCRGLCCSWPVICHCNCNQLHHVCMYLCVSRPKNHLSRNTVVTNRPSLACLNRNPLWHSWLCPDKDMLDIFVSRAEQRLLSNIQRGDAVPCYSLHWLMITKTEQNLDLRESPEGNWAIMSSLPKPNDDGDMLFAFYVTFFFGFMSSQPRWITCSMPTYGCPVKQNLVHSPHLTRVIFHNSHTPKPHTVHWLTETG